MTQGRLELSDGKLPSRDADRLKERIRRRLGVRPATIFVIDGSGVIYECSAEAIEGRPGEYRVRLPS